MQKLRLILPITTASLALVACGTPDDPADAGPALVKDLFAAYNDADPDAAEKVACERFADEARDMVDYNEDGEEEMKIASETEPDMNGEDRFSQDLAIESNLDGLHTLTFEFGKDDDGNWCIRDVSI